MVKFKAVVLAVCSLSAAPLASAETLHLRCEFYSQFYERRGDLIEGEEVAPAAILVSIDLETGIFSSGSTPGRATISADQIIAMSDDPRAQSLYVFNRATGEFRAVTYVRTDVNTVFLTAQGECRTRPGDASRF